MSVETGAAEVAIVIHPAHGAVLLLAWGFRPRGRGLFVPSYGWVVAFAGMGVTLTSLVTPSVLITAGSIVLNAFTERYDKLGDRLKSGEAGVTRRQLRLLRVSILAVLTGLSSLALSVVAVTLAVVLDSSALAYLAVAFVLVGANGIVVGLANAAIALQRRPDLAWVRSWNGA